MNATQENDEWVREQVAAMDREAAQRRAAALAKRKESIGIPARFLAITEGGDLRMTQARVAVMAGGFYVLVLSGKVGNGKTVAACGWLLGGLEDRTPPLFVSAARLSRWDRYDNAAMDRLLMASRLVIDDLGEEFNDTKGNFLAVLDETISDRLANNRATVITTNLDLEQFTERYGLRIRDRIKESGRWVEFIEPSMRGTP